MFFGILDSDKEYVARLANYINTCSDSNIEVLAFTEMELLEKYLENNSMTGLLIGENMNVDKVIHNVDKVIVITEEENDLPDVIYRYQPADKFVEKLRSITSQKVFGETVRETRLRGVYSIDGGEERSILALNLAYELGSQKRVLYISFEAFSGLGRILEVGNKKNLSDVMYLYLEGEEDISSKLEEYVVKAGGVDILQSVLCPEDLEDTDTGDFTEMILGIANKSIYDEIIMDIGNALKEQWRILNMCSKVYLINNQSDVADCRFEEFMYYLETRNVSGFSEKLQRVSLPVDNSMRTIKRPLYMGESLVIREYVRGLINE